MSNLAYFFVTVSQDLIDGLVYCPPQHWDTGNQPKLATWSPVPSDNMMPAKVKIRGREKPLAGEIYRLFFSREESREFTDSRTGKRCKSRDSYIVRLYTHDLQPPVSRGELRFATFPIGSELLMWPKPVFVVTFTGIREQGAFWIATPNVNYRVLYEKQKDSILFNGPVVVQVAGAEERKDGSVAIRCGSLTIYDRREDRLSSFARAEYVRRTVGRRTFEFVNLREMSAGEAVENPPEFVLTNAGFESIE